MDVISIVVSGILIVVLIIIIALLIRLYRNTRYTPIIFITTFFIILFINMLIYMPVLWLPYSESELIFLLFEITAYPLIMFFPLFVLFFEGMKGRFNSSISTVFLIYSCFIMGYMAIESPWEFEWSNRWHQIFNDDFIILTGILLVSFYVYVYYRLIQFVREKGSGRPKQMTIIAISGLTIALAGTFISMTLNLFYLDFIAWIIGFSIVAMAYLKEPESFFLSNTNIEAIFLLNSESQILYVNLGYPKGTDPSLAAAGLGGATTMVQEILDDEHPTTELVHKNKGFLFEYDFDHNVAGIIIVDQINPQLRAPLKHAISKFVSKYKAQLPDWDGMVDTFEDFEEELRTIFKFALVKN